MRSNEISRHQYFCSETIGIELGPIELFVPIFDGIFRTGSRKVLLSRKEKMATFVRNGKTLTGFFLNLRVDHHESTRDAFDPEKCSFVAIRFSKDELKSDLG